MQVVTIPSCLIFFGPASSGKGSAARRKFLAPPTTASAQCLRLSVRFFSFLLCLLFRSPRIGYLCASRFCLLIIWMKKTGCFFRCHLINTCHACCISVHRNLYWFRESCTVVESAGNTVKCRCGKEGGFFAVLSSSVWLQNALLT